MRNRSFSRRSFGARRWGDRRDSQSKRPPIGSSGRRRCRYRSCIARSLGSRIRVTDQPDSRPRRRGGGVDRRAGSKWRCDPLNGRVGGCLGWCSTRDDARGARSRVMMVVSTSYESDWSTRHWRHQDQRGSMAAARLGLKHCDDVIKGSDGANLRNRSFFGQRMSNA